MIYAAETFAGAMLEILVHSNLYRIPPSYVYIEIFVPEALAVQRLTVVDLPVQETFGDSAGHAASRGLGDRWLQEARSAVLVVPSVVTGGVETNILINPLHPDFKMITASDPKPIVWDSRFFAPHNR